MNLKKNRAFTGEALDVRRSPIDRLGLFTRVRLPPRAKIGELAGEVISVREARKRATGKRRLAIVERPDGVAVDASVGGNEFRYVNHSCRPNAFIRICYGRVEFYSLRRIAAGEEITCDYGENHHDGSLRCRCGSPACRGWL